MLEQLKINSLNLGVECVWQHVHWLMSQAPRMQKFQAKKKKSSYKDISTIINERVSQNHTFVNKTRL